MLLSVYFVNGQIIDIPDDNLKNALISNSALNTNSDSEISQSEAAAYTGPLSLSGLSIESAVGLNFFASVPFVDLSNNDLGYFNLFGSLSTELIDLSDNPNLLKVYINSLGYIGTIKVENCNSVEYISIYDENGINNITISNAPNLTSFDLKGTSNSEYQIGISDCEQLSCYSLDVRSSSTDITNCPMATESRKRCNLKKDSILELLDDEGVANSSDKGKIRVTAFNTDGSLLNGCSVSLSSQTSGASVDSPSGTTLNGFYTSTVSAISTGLKSFTSLYDQSGNGTPSTSSFNTPVFVDFDGSGGTGSNPSVSTTFIDSRKPFGLVGGTPAEVSISVLSSENTPIENVSVKFFISTGDGTFSQAIGNTNSSGVYKTNVSSNKQGSVTVTAKFDSDGNGSRDTTVINGSPVSLKFGTTIPSPGDGGAIGINTTEPDGSSILDINSSDRGVLFPRVDILSSSDKTTIPYPAVSLLVYNTNQSESLDVGFVYFDGNRWINL